MSFEHNILMWTRLERMGIGPPEKETGKLIFGDSLILKVKEPERRLRLVALRSQLETLSILDSSLEVCPFMMMARECSKFKQDFNSVLFLNSNQQSSYFCLLVSCL